MQYVQAVEKPKRAERNPENRRFRREAKGGGAEARVLGLHVGRGE